MNKVAWWQGEYHKLPSYPLPSLESDFARVGDVAVAAVSVAGAKSRFHASPNQDAYALLPAGADSAWLLIAVCDGVSAARHSHFGSRLLAKTIIRSLAATLRDASTKDSETAVTVALESALDAGNRALHNPDLIAHQLVQETTVALPLEFSDPLDLSSTITCAVVETRASAQGSHRAYIASVGDSPVYRIGDEGVRPLRPSESGQPLENATQALPVELETLRAATQMLDVMVEPGEALLLLTDGIGASLGDGTSAVAKYVFHQWRRPQPVPNLYHHIAGANFDRRGDDDDRTAVIVWIPPFAEPATSAQDPAAQ